MQRPRVGPASLLFFSFLSARSLSLSPHRAPARNPLHPAPPCLSYCVVAHVCAWPSGPGPGYAHCALRPPAPSPLPCRFPFRAARSLFRPVLPSPLCPRGRGAARVLETGTGVVEGPARCRAVLARARGWVLLLALVRCTAPHSAMYWNRGIGLRSPMSCAAALGCCCCCYDDDDGLLRASGPCSARSTPPPGARRAVMCCVPLPSLPLPLFAPAALALALSRPAVRTLAFARLFASGDAVAHLALPCAQSGAVRGIRQRIAAREVRQHHHYP